MVFHNVFQLKNQGENSDFWIFPEISSRYLDNPRFDDYSLKKIIKKGGLFL